MVTAAQEYSRVDKFIEEFNSNPDATSTVGHNHFSDLNSEQKKSIMNGSYKSGSKGQSLYNYYPINNTPITLKGSLNWTEEGASGPIRNQLQCGSCWAFTTAGLIESGYYFKTGELI
mmetsp:Transcript_30172/g.40923  ORF Transcript_30172/g.40923 Transcript_30172/m.40923 type:complete len:117 (+) Transcript_30172:98-448(+)